MSGASALVLIVEDDLAMRRFLRASLAAQGYRTMEAGTQREAEVMVTTQNPDVMVLDLGLPDGDGIAFVKALREWSRVPIVVVSARGREDDKVIALDAGADDYLTKPFGVQELLARVRVALRHADARTSDDPVLVVGPIAIDLTRRVVTREGEEVHLTPTEYRMLVLLARNVGRVLTRSHLEQSLYGWRDEPDSNALEVHIHHLRKKLGSELIRTLRGVGYTIPR